MRRAWRKGTREMCVGILKLELHLPASNSLKHKRMILNSLKAKLKNRFNVSVAEIGARDKWQRAVIAVCQVGSDRRYVCAAMEAVSRFAGSFTGADLIREELEML